MSDPRYGDDLEVLTALREWSAVGDAGALVTVLRTWGSSPRPPGSLLAVRRRDGHLAGSVSGGCVEADLAARYVRGELADCPTTLDYGADPAGAARFGLPCGGRLELLIEEPPVEPLRPVIEAIEGGRLLERRVCLTTGEVSLHPPTGGQEFRYADATVFKRFGPHWQLLMVGAGPIADHLARIALTLGFGVSLCEPRTELGTEVDGVRLTRDMPDDVVIGLEQRQRTAVVTLAHDPRVDDMALMEALQAGFFYVGALGSRRTSLARRERLRALDLSTAQIDTLHAPVGVAIGSRTPAEIAVAIAADLIAARHAIDPAS